MRIAGDFEIPDVSSLQVVGLSPTVLAFVIPPVPLNLPTLRRYSAGWTHMILLISKEKVTVVFDPSYRLSQFSFSYSLI
jgi:hypothetical protein